VKKIKNFIKFIVGFMALLVAALVGACMFWLDPLVKKTVETVGPQALGTEVRVENVSIHPLRGIVDIEGLHVGNLKGYSHPNLFDVKECRVNLDLFSLLSDTVVIDEVLIDRPQIAYERRSKTDNIKDLQKNVEVFAEKLGGAQEKLAKEKAEKSAKKVLIRRLLVRDGKVIAKLSSLPAVPLPLPEIERTNIGGETGGTSIADATKEVLGSLRGSATDAAKGVGDVAKDAIKDAKGAVQGVGGFLKRSKP